MGMLTFRGRSAVSAVATASPATVSAPLSSGTPLAQSQDRRRRPRSPIRCTTPRGLAPGPHLSVPQLVSGRTLHTDAQPASQQSTAYGAGIDERLRTIATVRRPFPAAVLRR